MAKRVNKLLDLEISRVYRCTSCQYQEHVVQKASDDFLHKCPACKKDDLVIEEANCGLNVAVGINSPKTIGALAEKNRTIKERNGELSPKDIDGLRGTKKPWWRKKNKIDYSILKNPEKYIKKGVV